MRYLCQKQCEERSLILKIGRPLLLALLGALVTALVASCSMPDGLDLASLKSMRHHKPPATDSVQLSWNANSESNLAGYKLYMRVSSGAYGTPSSIGKVTTTNVTTLTPGTTNYFALSALNSTGQESAKTAEISYLAP